MSARPEFLGPGRESRSWLIGVLVAASAVAVATMVIYPLRGVAPAVSTGVVYLLTVLLVSTYWGLLPGLVTAVVSTAAFDWFHIVPTGRFTIADAENWVALAVLLAAASIASALAELARGRAEDAELRREEADLAAAMARSLLSGAELPPALRAASTQLADALGLPGARIELGGASQRDDRLAVPLESVEEPAGVAP